MADANVVIVHLAEIRGCATSHAWRPYGGPDRSPQIEQRQWRLCELQGKISRFAKGPDAVLVAGSGLIIRRKFPTVGSNPTRPTKLALNGLRRDCLYAAAAHLQPHAGADRREVAGAHVHAGRRAIGNSVDYLAEKTSSSCYGCGKRIRRRGIGTAMGSRKQQPSRCANARSRSSTGAPSCRRLFRRCSCRRVRHVCFLGHDVARGGFAWPGRWLDW